MAGEKDPKFNDAVTQLNQELEDLALSDDPFAPQPEKKAVNPIQEDEVTVRDVLGRQQKVQVDEDTVIQKPIRSVAPKRSELPSERKKPPAQNGMPQAGRFKSYLRILLFLTLGASLVLGGFFIWKTVRLNYLASIQRKAGRTKAEKRVDAQAPRVGALSFNQDGKITGPRALLPGTVTVTHTIESWQARSGQPARLVESIRLFDSKGKLILSNSQLASFAGKIDGRSRKLKFTAELTISPQAQSGDYRLIIEVTDLNAKRSALLQSRLTLTAPKSN